MGIDHEIRVTPIRLNGNIDRAVDVSLAGEFDLSTAGELQERLARADVSRAARVRVDLTHVSFIDSTTIKLLLSTCKKVRSAGGVFSMSCSEGPVLQILGILGLMDYFEVHGAQSLSDASA